MAHFSEVQERFMSHIRDPENNAGDPALEDRRLKIYRDLFFNNVRGFLSSGFPVLESLYSKEQWDVIVRGFFAKHDCRSPYFVDISKEFVEYLSNEYQVSESDYPFMQELAHYEWVELDLSVRQGDISNQIWDGTSDVASAKFSPLAQLLSYQFPVHQIKPDFTPSAPLAEPCYLVVNRTAEDDVEFTHINNVTAFLLNLIQGQDQADVEGVIEIMAQNLPNMSHDQITNATLDIMKQMLRKQILLPVMQ